MSTDDCTVQIPTTYAQHKMIVFITHLFKVNKKHI